MYVYHGYECLKNPRLCKAVHCCLSVSIAIHMASCSRFQLPCFVALIRYGVLGAEMYPHSFVVLSHPADISKSRKSEV